MNREETKQILSILKAAYPSFYNGQSREELFGVLALWCDMFADDDVGAVATAVKSLIATRTETYPPVIGEVRQHLAKVSRPQSPEESAAWAMVSKAVRNGIYGYNKEWEKLPPEVQAVVGSPEQLRAWAMMPSDEVETVIASNFKRSYRTEMVRAKENAMLPKDLRNIIGGMCETKMIGD